MSLLLFWKSAADKLLCSGVLNVCCPYASRDEITTAMKESVRRAYEGELAPR